MRWTMPSVAGANWKVSTANVTTLARFLARHAIGEDVPESLPVPIARLVLDDGWILTYKAGMTSLFGFAIITGPVRTMTINADLDIATQRFVIAHELAHVLNGDIGSLHLCQFAPWFKSKAERWASATAAEILIPESALWHAGTVRELAVLCDVPYEVAELRLSGMRV